MEVHERIIWSADEPTMKALGRGIKAMDGLRRVKIDRLFMERRNPSILGRIRDDYGVEIFDDAKFIEIPTKLEELALTHLKYRPWMLNCMAGGVSTEVLDNPKTLDGLKRFADACRKYDTLPCGVTVLTSKSEDVVQAEFGRSAIDQVLYYVGVLDHCGFTDVVCSPLEIPVLRQEATFAHMSFNTPGIVIAGADPRDQARTNTPGGAIRAGSTRLVIGGALTIGDKAENFRVISREVELALAA